LPSLIPYIWLFHAIMIPQSFYYAADKYEERLKSNSFIRRWSHYTIRTKLWEIWNPPGCFCPCI